MSNVKFDFEGKIFVVTGASSGMGKEIVLELARAGAVVLAVARGTDKLEQLKVSQPDNIQIAAVDVCDYQKMEETITKFVEQNGKIDGVVHAAGITSLTPLKSYDDSQARTIMEVNYWSAIKIVQLCSKVKMSNNGASFIMFSSVSASKPDKGIFAYASTKNALRTVVRSFAKEIAKRRLRINSISPGWVNTSMTDGLEETHNLADVENESILGYGNPSDVSGMVLFLLSDRAAWITGSDVVVDGGYLA